MNTYAIKSLAVRLDDELNPNTNANPKLTEQTAKHLKSLLLSEEKENKLSNDKEHLNILIDARKVLERASEYFSKQKPQTKSMFN